MKQHVRDTVKRVRDEERVAGHSDPEFRVWVSEWEGPNPPAPWTEGVAFGCRVLWVPEGFGATFED